MNEISFWSLKKKLYMKTNEKILSLIGYGLKPSWLMSLNESQIDGLHKRMIHTKKNVSEQVTQVPGKPSYKIGPNGGTLPENPTKKGYAIKQNADKTITAVPMDENEMTEKSVSKKQHGLMGAAYSVEKGDKELSDIPKSYRGKVKKIVDSMSKKQVKDFAKTKTSKLPEKVETKEGGYMDMVGKAFNKNMQNKIADIKPGLKWESILEDEFSQIIENTIFPKMTKRDFIKTIMESPEVAPEKERTTEKEKERETEKRPDKNDPFRPGKRRQPKPAPKAKHKKEMRESPEVAPAPVKVPEREKEKSPDKNDPFRPGKRQQPKPAPKAKLPEWLTSKSIGLK